MGALLMALVPILTLAFGTSASAIVAGLTIAQWAALAAALLTESTEIQAQYSAIHPLLADLLSDAARFGPQTAAEKMKDNAERTAFGFENPSNPGVIP
jgi:hypothetical protein